MAEWQAVGPEGLLADGQMAEVTVGDAQVLLVRVGGQYYAAQGLCPHMGGHLARGRLDGHVVTCPRHGSQFDLRDGHNVVWIPQVPSLARKLAQTVKKPEGLRTYATRLQDGQIWVEI